MQGKRITFDVSYAAFIKIILISALLLFIYLVREILLFIFVAIVIASAIDPWVDFLQKRRIPRWLSVVLIFLVMIGVLVASFALVVPPVVEQVQQLVTAAPTYIDSLSEKISEITAGTISIDQDDANNFIESLGSRGSDFAGGIYETVAGVFGGVISLVLIFVLSFYFTVQESAFKKFIRSLSPAKHRPYVDDLISRIQQQMGKWLRGQLFLGLVVGVLVYTGLKIMGVKYALVLAIFAGVTELIPYIGPVLGAIPTIFVALGSSLFLGALVAGLYIVVQQLENHILVPKIMQKVVGLNPLVIILCILTGAKLAGILGALLAIPVATAVNVFLSDIFEEKEKNDELARRAAKEVSAREDNSQEI